MKRNGATEPLGEHKGLGVGRVFEGRGTKKDWCGVGAGTAGERKVTARKGCWVYISLQYQSALSMWRRTSHTGGSECSGGRGWQRSEEWGIRGEDEERENQRGRVRRKGRDEEECEDKMASRRRHGRGRSTLKAGCVMHIRRILNDVLSNLRHAARTRLENNCVPWDIFKIASAFV